MLFVRIVCTLLCVALLVMTGIVWFLSKDKVGDRRPLEVYLVLVVYVSLLAVSGIWL